MNKAECKADFSAIMLHPQYDEMIINMTKLRFVLKLLKGLVNLLKFASCEVKGILPPSVLLTKARKVNIQNDTGGLGPGLG